jgi:hypothetical protein
VWNCTVKVLVPNCVELECIGFVGHNCGPGLYSFGGSLCGIGL